MEAFDKSLEDVVLVSVTNAKYLAAAGSTLLTPWLNSQMELVDTDARDVYYYKKFQNDRHDFKSIGQHKLFEALPDENEFKQFVITVNDLFNRITNEDAQLFSMLKIDSFDPATDTNPIQFVTGCKVTKFIFDHSEINGVSGYSSYSKWDIDDTLFMLTEYINKGELALTV
jgi:hypothetical protein